MTSFILRRLAMLIPSVFGISLVTFVLINLAVQNPETLATDARGTAMARDTADSLGRAYGLHLPLFLNLSIADIRTRTKADMEQLAIPQKREAAIRSLVRMGGAVMPWVLPELQNLQDAEQTAVLEALDRIAEDLTMAGVVDDRSDRLAFWTDYHSVYGSDFSPVRASRLVRRYAVRNDRLALSELKRLGTYSLPQLMSALNEETDPVIRTRIVALLCEVTGRDDPLASDASMSTQEDVIGRWNEWWYQRYDLYTAFDGFSRITGAITETRYFRWLSRVITFDFGVSARDGRPIRTKIAERLPVTLLLSFLSLVLSYLVAIPLGVITALKQGTLFDRITGVALFVLYSLPSFWVAMILLRYFGGTGFLDWFPSQGLRSVDLPPNAGVVTVVLDRLHHLVLPVLCLSLVSIAMLARYQRIGMLQIHQQNYIRTARAKGLSEFQVIVRHGLRNGVIPIISLMGLQLPYLVSSSVVIERIFGIQGLGAETFEAIQSSDYYWLLAVIAVTAVLTALGIFVSDLVHALIDPRIIPDTPSKGRRG